MLDPVMYYFTKVMKGMSLVNIEMYVLLSGI